MNDNKGNGFKTKSKKRTRTIKVDYLARVEGEGGLFISLRENVVQDVQLRIFEPPRFFEALLRERAYTEAPDITARICGICPVAYQMSSCHAMESACGVSVGGALRELRRLLYCAEWIESHTLHMYMLHAPDFLGFESGVALGRVYPDVLKQGLELKKLGNELLSFLGGREIHPINVKVGGFYRVPSKKEMNDFRPTMVRARDLAEATVRWVAEFPFPEFDIDYTFVSLQHPDEYPMNEGRIVSNKGLAIDIEDFEKHFEEQQVEHSTALHSIMKNGEEYLVGPLARFALNHEKLSNATLELANSIKLKAPCTNPFKSILVRALEVFYVCDEAIRIIDHYVEPEESFVSVAPRAGEGFGCTEAPRGLLFHRFRINAEGVIEDAKIVPPTSQNQKSIESDVRAFIEQNHELPEAELTHRCEQTIRNYDPCISCSTHFLKLHIDRG